jgi:hypothetical protein
MAGLRDGDSVYVVLFFSNDPEEPTNAIGVFDSEEEAESCVEELSDSMDGIFDIIERALNQIPTSEE